MELGGQQRVVEALQANWRAEMRGFYVYSHLAEGAAEPSTRRALRGLAAAEKHHADLWADRLHALSASVPPLREVVSPEAVGVLVQDRSFRSLELEESEDIARYGEQIQQFGDPGSLEVLERILKDEQEHYRVLKTLSDDARPNETGAQKALEELLAKRQKGRVQAGSWIGDAIYGVNDGLGSIFGIVSGVSGATLGNSHFVLIAGIAGMVASALSMGSGAYLAAKSEREIYQAELAREEQSVQLNPIEARELLSLTYQVRGIPQDDADRVVEHLAVDERRLAEVLARERLNTTEAALSQPWISAISGALSTAVGAFIPVIPFFFTSGIRALALAAVTSLAAHFAVGAMKTLVTNRSWWSSGLEMTWVGALEGAVTYVVGMGLGRLGSSL